MKKIIFIGFLFLGIVSLGYLKLSSNNKDMIGAYIDGEYTEDIPAKGSVLFDHVECDNGATGTWNNDAWGLLTTNMTKRTKCNIYFRVPVINKIMANLNTTGKCPTVNADGSVSVTSIEDGGGYVCSAPDAYGTSYYFRGNVTNNYVYFAGYYWRIIRVNGDGTIRIIYDGTSAHKNEEASPDRQIGTSAFNTNYDDNAYIGYMYGKLNATSYAETHANTNSSTVKQYIDKWHEDHIKTNYSSYLADNVFCNDRSISSYKPEYFTNSGYSKNHTLYRWFYGPWDSDGYNDNIKLVCPQKNDAFTANDTTYGNGALTYPVGLLSEDEAMLAGGWNTTNLNYYLHTGNSYWVSSPWNFDGVARVRGVNSNGDADVSGFDMTDSIGGVRPVYNLKPNSLISGDGSMDNPYSVANE